MLKRVLAMFCVLFTLAVAAFLGSPFLETAQAQEKSKSRAAVSAQPEAVFTNPAPITIISQAPASPYPSTVSVSGITGNIPTTPGSVKVTINNFSHTFTSDVAMMLVGPTGAAFLIQDGAGAPPPGGSAVSNVTYTLSDTGAAFLPLTTWTPGTYKPTSYFTGDSFPPPAPATFAEPGPAGSGATFTSVFGGTNPNGDWKLYVVDFIPDDNGSISGGWTLEIASGVAVNEAPVDMNGDGKSDFVVVRNTSGATSGEITWHTILKDGPPAAPTVWGIATDTYIPADFDGDAKDDVAVWRPGSPGRFYIIRSSSQTFIVEDFGQTGDDPTVSGDYTGDNKDDLAVYRAGATPGTNSFWYYRSIGSTSGFQTVEWGQNGDFPAPGDYDGDNKYDFVVQRADTNGVNGRFFVRTSVGAQYSELFGLASDVVVPGDYDDDGKTDLAVVRDSGGVLRWDFEPSGTAGSTVVTDTWGVTATDFITQGDYDGDGRTDYSVWRPGNPGVFYMMTVGNRIITTRTWGVTGDYPVANYNEH